MNQDASDAENFVTDQELNAADWEIPNESTMHSAAWGWVAHYVAKLLRFVDLDSTKETKDA